MVEKICLSSESPEIIGKVEIAYIDGLTAKIKERISGKNHVFADQLNTKSWDTILGSTAPLMFVTDDNTPPDDNFQYLRGNIIGWGANGTAGSGSYHGAYIAESSHNKKLLPNNAGLSWKYVYEYNSTQIPAKIGSVGLTNQYMPLGSYNFPNYPMRVFPYVRENIDYAYFGGLGYTIANTGIITVYNPSTGAKSTIDVSSTTGTTSTLSVGFDYAGGKAYVLAYKTATADRKMYAFGDETFSLLMNTYAYPALTTYPSSSKIFAVWGADWYHYSSGWYKGNYTTNENPTVIASPSCPYNPTLMPSNFGSLISRNGKLHVFRNYGAYRTPILDIQNGGIQVATVGTGSLTSTSYAQQCFFAPFSANKPILISNYSEQYYFFRNALTCYNLPADAPERPNGSGVKITYQIDVNY